MVVAFTGHRPDKLGGYRLPNPVQTRVETALRRRLEQLLKAHRDLLCLSGMALGVDQWAAAACIELGVPFKAFVPFIGQESMWPEPAQRRYRHLIERASSVLLLREAPPGYGAAPRLLQKRNEAMVDRCELLLAVWDGSPGGTANCVRYAEAIGKPVEKLEWR
jgi:uncharacterized phage-like protein YoqJ